MSNKWCPFFLVMLWSQVLFSFAQLFFQRIVPKNEVHLWLSERFYSYAINMPWFSSNSDMYKRPSCQSTLHRYPSVYTILIEHSWRFSKPGRVFFSDHVDLALNFFTANRKILKLFPYYSLPRGNSFIILTEVNDSLTWVQIPVLMIIFFAICRSRKYC